ncbi:MAG: glycosyltransferase family 4 protein, partial [Anaerolineales bacterium]
ILLADCQRDIRLASVWGFPINRPSHVFPGAGGVRRDLFYPLSNSSNRESQPLIINPRGMRAYVRNDIFFKAIALVQRQVPELRVVCPGMKGEMQAQRWVSTLHLENVVQLYPQLNPKEIASLFQKAHISVSLTEHDGTPNTLLETMACGCFPIAGDLESIREWIIPGINGFITPANDPGITADFILFAIKNQELREKAAQYNQQVIESRADYNQVMEKVRKVYLEASG